MAQDFPRFKLHILPGKKIHTRVLWMASNAYWGEEDKTFFSLLRLRRVLSHLISQWMWANFAYISKSQFHHHHMAQQLSTRVVPGIIFTHIYKALFMVFIFRMRSLEWVGNKNATCLMMKMLVVQKKKRWLGCHYISMCKLAWVCAALAPSMVALLGWCENF